jgi:polyisoprenoid-binding protein YceI
MRSIGRPTKGHAMTLPLPAGRWILDDAHSTVEFSVRHMGISKVRGRFTEFAAELTVGDTTATSRLDATVALASIDTGNETRDGHLRTTDFFDLATTPVMTFTSSSIADRGDGTYVADGSLTLNGRTQPQQLVVEFNGTETYPMDGSVHAGFSATGSLSRKDFGVDFNVPLAAGGVVIGDRISIEIDVQVQLADAMVPA